MKKFMVVALCFAVAVGLVAMVGCGKETPAGPDTNATATAVAAAATAAANASATAVAVATANAVVFSFASDVQSWEASDVFTNLTHVSTAGEGYNGTTGYVTVDAVFDSGTDKGTFKWTSPWDNGISDFTRINMTGRTITFHIYVPAGLVDTTNPYGVKVYAQNKSWQWKDMWFNITGSGWQTYSWNVSGAYNTCQWTDCNDATEVIQIGVEITKSNASSPDFTGTLYFDEIAY